MGARNVRNIWKGIIWTTYLADALIRDLVENVFDIYDLSVQGMHMQLHQHCMEYGIYYTKISCYRYPCYMTSPFAITELTLSTSIYFNLHPWLLSATMGFGSWKEIHPPLYLWMWLFFKGKKALSVSFLLYLLITARSLMLEERFPSSLVFCFYLS